MSGCNACFLERLKKEYGDKLIKHAGAWYLYNELPIPGQAPPTVVIGKEGQEVPIRFVAWFMSEGHDHSITALDDAIDSSWDT